MCKCQICRRPESYFIQGQDLRQHAHTHTHTHSLSHTHTHLATSASFTYIFKRSALTPAPFDLCSFDPRLVTPQTTCEEPSLARCFTFFLLSPYFFFFFFSPLTPTKKKTSPAPLELSRRNIECAQNPPRRNEAARRSKLTTSGC